jgi:hypothetical protein
MSICFPSILIQFFRFLMKMLMNKNIFLKELFTSTPELYKNDAIVTLINI